MLNYITLVAAAVACVLIAAHQPAAEAQQPPPPRNETNICTGQAVNTLIADVGDCQRFFRCTAAGPQVGQCAVNHRFNATGQSCTTNQVNCFRCPSEQYFVDLPLDYNCLQFVRCFAGRARQHTCSEGLLFDPVRRQCNFERQVTCPCPARDEPARPLFVRRWTACDQYHVCANGTAHAARCQPGLRFNLQTQQCDFPDAVNCDGPSTSGFN